MSLLLSSSFTLSPHKPPPPSLFLNQPNTSKISVVSGGFSNPRKLSQRTMNTLPIKAAISVDQDVDRKTFDDTKNGVKGLAESGITSIPPFFVHPPKILSKFKLPDTRPDPSLVPVVDFTGAESGRREEIVKELARISKEIGFFQITNHGIPEGLLEETIAAVRAFHEQPVELKAPFYHREMSRGSSYYSNVDLFECEAACWGDTLRVMGPPRPEVIPEVCRTQIIETYGRLTKLADLLMGILCEGLGVDPQKYKHLTALEAWTIVGLYYPPCPQPDLTVGQLNHTDPGFFTLLLQDQVGGLQVRYRDEWVDVVPIPGAIAINVGDIFEVMSNGQYISADHRVLANRKKQSRVSTAFFFRPSNWESEFGPFEELISPEDPPRYRGFTLTDFVTRFVTQAFDGKGSLLNYYRIEDK